MESTLHTSTRRPTLKHKPHPPYTNTFTHALLSHTEHPAHGFFLSAIHVECLQVYIHAWSKFSEEHSRIKWNTHAPTKLFLQIILEFDILKLSHIGVHKRWLCVSILRGGWKPRIGAKSSTTYMHPLHIWALQNNFYTTNSWPKVSAIYSMLTYHM